MWGRGGQGGKGGNAVESTNIFCLYHINIEKSTVQFIQQKCYLVITYFFRIKL